MSIKSDLKSTLIVFLLFGALGLVSFMMSPQQTQGPHGGTLKKAEGYFIEMKNFEKVLSVYLLNEKLRSVDTKAITGEVKLFFPDSTDLILQLKHSYDNMFTCKLPGDYFSCKITFNVGGKPVMATFENSGQIVLKK
ncbi:MAG TPA: hypothetical protein VN026_14980 [Bacteroidia bacterium]|nr:hypothetical protein [Bacteroidia bacterium]